MIPLTSRQKKIIIFLSQKKMYTTVSQLCSLFSVSDRTIRKDLDSIELFLRENHIELVRKTGKGIFINTLEDITVLFEKTNQKEVLYYDKQERETIILIHLLTNEKVTLQSMANACLVSRQTIVNDMTQIEKIIHVRGLHLVKNPGIGTSLEGKELNVRRMFIDLLLSDDHQDFTLKILSASEEIVKNQKKASLILKGLQELLGIVYIDQKRIELTLSFFLYRIATNRKLKHFQIPVTENQNFHSIVRILGHFISSHQDVEYVSSFLLAERMERAENLGLEPLDEASAISKRLITSLQNIHYFDEETMKDIIQGLTIHIRAAIYRSRNHIHIQNELKEQIRFTKTVFYEFARKELSYIEQIYGLSFDENEISFIALYLASIFEAGTQNTLRVSILIVCTFGLATSSILKMRMEQMFGDCDIKGPYSRQEAQDYLKKNRVDLVITTNPIEAENTTIIHIDPLLKKEDVDLIRDILFQKSFSKMCSLFFSKKESRQKSVHYLGDYIPRECVQIEKSKNLDWEQAIRKASLPLLKRHFIEESYVHTMIHAVHEFGTYMVVTPKVAYVHAGKENGVNQNCVSILILDEEIPFGSFNIKPVQGIVVLGICDKEEGQMLNIANILDKEENINKLSKIKEIQELLSLHD